jgi:hypothetical protein
MHLIVTMDERAKNDPLAGANAQILMGYDPVGVA